MDQIEHNDQSIFCIENQRNNERIVKWHQLYLNYSICLIRLTPEKEKFWKKCVEIISGSTNKKIAFKRIYKDKETFATIMQHHAFVNQLSFLAERSSASR